MKPTKLSADQIQNTLYTAISEAVAFVEAEIAPLRIKAQRYFDGKVDLPSDEGRSRVVATKCRDAVRAVKPGLMRLFLQSGMPVEFAPKTPQSSMEAQQKTKYASYVFDANGGFRLLSNAFDDALKKKVGILKVQAEADETVEIDEYSEIDEDQVAILETDPEVEVLEKEQNDDLSYSMKVARKMSSKRIRIDSVAPEDFFVDRNSTSIDDCYICGHSTEARVGDLVAMGFDFNEVFNLAGTGEGRVDEEEELQRRGWDAAQDDESPNDPSMRKVLLTEAYMKMDIEGTGVPRMYRFICGGEKYQILERELCDDVPFAIFEVDPEAHAFFGRSLVEIILDDQDAATAMLRGLLDNMQMVNNPRLEVVQNMVNMDDVLNNEIGGIIRVKQPGQMREIVVGGMATALLPAIDYYDQTIRAKTGVVGAGMGLDADALQSQTAAGVRMMDQTNSATMELMARHLAEGGMKRLFKLIAKMARAHADQQEVMRVNGEFVPVDPRSWTMDMDLTVNVGLGTGRHEERAMALRETLQTQMGIWQAYGPTNGLVTMTQIRNTLEDILKASGLYNADRYYQPMNPQTEQMLMMQAAQMAQSQTQQSDPNAAFLQAEQMKVSARVQADQQKAALDFRKAQMQDDRERDKMVQDLAIKVAEIIAKTGVAIDTAAIKAEQQANNAQMMPQQSMGQGNV